MRQRMNAQWRRWLPAMAVALSSLLLVALVSQLPVALLADAHYDDGWFWQRAESIVAGQWLGGYDHLTLVKGVGYPLFLAASHLSGLSVSASQAILYAGACLLLGSAVQRMAGRPWLSVLVVVALQWHPAAMAWSRVLRDDIGAAQVLVVLACLLHFLMSLREGRRNGWPWAVMAGLALGWLWTTREDGAWVVPGVALLLVAGGAWAWRSGRGRLKPGIGVALVALSFAGWLALVAGMNQARYGVFLTVETREGAYVDALSALQRVRVGDPVPFVPVPAKVREAVYAASPAFARLRPRLEEPGAPWMSNGCRLYPHSCGDYAGGWFMWALRDAAAATGAHASAPAAGAFYRQLADEVDAACADGRLACAQPLVGRVPPITGAQWRSLPGHLASALSLLTWQGVGEGTTESHVASLRARPMWEFLGTPRVPDPADTLGTRASGWFHGARPGWLRLWCPPPLGSRAIERMPSPDIARHFNDPDAGQSRFAIAVPDAAGCAIALDSGEGAVALQDVGGKGRGFTLGGARLHFDSIHEGIPVDAEASMALRWVRHWIGLAYGAVLPWLAVAGLLAFAWMTLRALRLRRLEPMYLLAAAAWCLVAGRVGLLVLVELSAFPALKVHYMQPAFPLLLLAAIASISSVRAPGLRRMDTDQCPSA